MKTITILSGKGGVGKSSIVASLAVSFARDKKIICADCDVDASNLSLVLGVEKYEEWKDLSTNEKADFDLDKCISCKRCHDECYFNAIRWKDNKPELNEFSCEGCGLCKLICPAQAISLKKINNAKIGYADSRFGFKVVSAQLNPGESGSGKVVSEVRKMAKRLGNGSEILFIDSAAGIGCPVIASVTGSDYAIIVTEPTPSGFSDMKRALDIIKHFGIPCSVIINKYDLDEEHTRKIERFAGDNSLDIIAKIPFDRSFAKALAEMIPIIEYRKDYKRLFDNIRDKLKKQGILKA